MSRFRFLLMAGVTLICGSTPSRAVNGTLLTGYGSKASGMGGASIALPQDAIAAANNPAGMALVGTRCDADLQFFNLHSSNVYDGARHHGSNFVGFPEIGCNQALSSKVTIGMSTAGNGGGFRYSSSLFPNITGSHTNTLLLSVAALPTITYRPKEHLVVGASFAGGFQMFRLRSFAGLPHHGWDGWNAAFGSGWRLGALWQPTTFLSFGASYASKVRFGRFKGYAGDLLAPVDGKLDTLAQAGAGIAITPRQGLTLAFDYLHVDWQDTQYHELFGYRSQNVLRAGISDEFGENLTLRTGVSLTRRPFSRDFVAQNITFPGFTSKAITAGASHKLGTQSDVSVSVEDDLGGRYVGTGPSDRSSIHPHFQIFSIGWGHHF